MCLARAALHPVHTFLRTRAWAMTRTRRVLSQSPRKMAADGGLSYKETNKVNSQVNARETCLPTVTLHLREPHLVGSDNLERDLLFLPSSWPSRPLAWTVQPTTPLTFQLRVKPSLIASESNPPCYSLLVVLRRIRGLEISEAWL